jgi:hypothetical protein
VKRSRSKRQQIIFSILGLVVVSSMILSLIVAVIPQPEQPTPTPEIRRITPVIATPQPTPTPTLIPTATSASS